jgi:VWFA-related protein
VSVAAVRGIALVFALAAASTPAMSGLSTHPTVPQAVGPPVETTWFLVTVTDAAGRPVPALEQQDFVVQAGGRERPIAVFSRDELPMTMFLMLDVSRSMVRAAPFVRRAAEELIGGFVRGDRIGIGSFSTTVSVTPRFTANRAEIMRALDRTLSGANAPCMPSQADRPGMRGAPLPLARERYGATALWDAVACGVGELLRDRETLRRVLVLITDGSENASHIREHEAVRLATQAGVVVYLVGLPGDSGRSGALLRDLAIETGGGYFPIEERDLQRDVSAAFGRILDELRHQYVIGIDARSGTDGEVTVGVRAPGVTVRARQAIGAPAWGR